MMRVLCATICFAMMTTACKTRDDSMTKDVEGHTTPGSYPNPEPPPQAGLQLPGAAWRAEYTSGGFAGPQIRLHRLHANGEVARDTLDLLHECQETRGSVLCKNTVYEAQINPARTAGHLKILKENMTVALKCKEGKAPSGARIICDQSQVADPFPKDDAGGIGLSAYCIQREPASDYGYIIESMTLTKKGTQYGMAGVRLGTGILDDQGDGTADQLLFEEETSVTPAAATKAQAPDWKDALPFHLPVEGERENGRHVLYLRARDFSARSDQFDALLEVAKAGEIKAFLLTCMSS